MWGVLSGMFTSKNVDRAGEGLYNGIDNMFFTEEEKSVANQKILDWKLEYAAATAPMNVARRFIAIVVTLLWAAMVAVMVIAEGFGFSDFSKFVFDAMKEIVLYPFITVLGFYFLAHVVKRAAKE